MKARRAASQLPLTNSVAVNKEQERTLDLTNEMLRNAPAPSLVPTGREFAKTLRKIRKLG